MIKVAILSAVVLVVFAVGCSASNDDPNPTIEHYYQCVERARADYPEMLSQFKKDKVAEKLVDAGYGEYRPVTPAERCGPRYSKMGWETWPLFLVNPVYPKYDYNDTKPTSGYEDGVRRLAVERSDAQIYAEKEMFGYFDQTQG